MNVVASYVDQKIPIKVQCLSIQLSCVMQVGDVSDHYAEGAGVITGSGTSRLAPLQSGEGGFALPIHGSR